MLGEIFNSAAYSEDCIALWVVSRTWIAAKRRKTQSHTQLIAFLKINKRLRIEHQWNLTK